MRPVKRRFLLSTLGVISMALAGCSGAGAPDAAVAGQQPGAAYALNDEEKALDCKKLIGRVQVRILQVRDFEERARPSSVSHALQSAAVMAGSSATRGLDPAAENGRDRAQLEAYNQRLAELKCKTFNLDGELRPKPVTATPVPLSPAKDKKS